MDDVKMQCKYQTGVETDNSAKLLKLAQKILKMRFTHNLNRNNLLTAEVRMETGSSAHDRRQ